ncbi:hypothetical protein GALL_552800 [mine drainage metagenome]|uniref:Uncharacterized protein n=1 Tax=mine drainage metagenome TaxID=410659 RepID=A0A1J5PHZ2_9ZZZZ
MAPGRVCPGYIKAIGQFNIIITNRHAVFAQSHFIGGNRAAHTQTRVGIDVIAANKTFHQFIDHIIFFSKALPRCIKCHRVRSILIDKSFKNSGGTVKGLIPAYPLHGHIFIIPHLRVKQPVALIIYSVMQVEAFAAQHPLVYGMRRISFNQYIAALVLVDKHAATHPAITTGRS